MLEDTGERIIPEQMKITNNLLVEHLARYHFVHRYIKGRILDFACGSGYGTHIIVKNNQAVTEVVGVDFNSEAIKYARHNYYHPKSSFMKGNVVDRTLPSKLGQFDCIVSFETYEHIKEEADLLANIYDMLKPGGILILSTPFGEGRDKPSRTPFHVHQITKAEFKNLFNNYTEVEFFYQDSALIVPENFTGNTYFPVGIAVCQK